MTATGGALPAWKAVLQEMFGVPAAFGEAWPKTSVDAFGQPFTRRRPRSTVLALAVATVVKGDPAPRSTTLTMVLALDCVVVA